ncbi:reverse transcriptase domain-containing protein [Tanacetum coccineum]|uniref:Reverse transcriptase domain-containing protein n=1 Tax=Tanacetum coccineum TaxID=301880 RepID=A0ABQ4ZN04_9ASTR
MAGIEYMHQLWLFELECLVVKLQQVEKMEATPKSPGSRMRDRAHVNLFHAREYRKRVAGGREYLKELGECKTEENYTRFLTPQFIQNALHISPCFEEDQSYVKNINSNEGKRGELYYQLGNGLYRIGDGESAKKALEDCLKARNLLVNVELILRADEPKNKISKSTLPKHMVVTGGLALGVTCGCLSKSKLLKHVVVAGRLALSVACTMILSWEKLDEFAGGIKKAGELGESIEKMIGKDSYPTVMNKNGLSSQSGFFQISIAPEDQEKTTFTCSYSTFAYRRMPFGLCNVHATFQRCMTTIFHDMVEDFMEVFMDDFSVFRHKISGARIEVDRAKIDVIAKFSYPTNVKGVRSFLEHAGFYCSDFAVGSVLGQRIDGKFKPIYYASKTLNNAQEHYTTTEKELLAVVLSFDKFRPYRIISKIVVYTDHSALKYLLSKQDAKPRLIRWVLLFKGLTSRLRIKKGEENLAVDHLSRLENPYLGAFTKEEIADEFPTNIWLQGDKDFKFGDKVLPFNSRFKIHPGKLKSRWYGPNVVKIVYLYGTVEITDKNGISFKVNGQRLKKYYDECIDTDDKEVVEF